MRLSAAMRRLRNELKIATTTTRELRRLRQADHPSAPAMADALDRAVRNGASADARAWIDRIDGLRRELLANDAPLDPENLDNGASPKSIAVAALGTSLRDWGTVQLLMVQALKPTSCLELGASLGISGSYIGGGLELAGDGQLVSYELSLARAALATKHWADLGVSRARLITHAFEPDAEELAEIEPIDFAFLDAHHEPEATLQFTDSVLEHLSPTGVLLFDDIRWSKGMEYAWGQLTADERVAVSIDLGRVGICMYGPSGPTTHVRLHSRLRGSMITT